MIEVQNLSKSFPLQSQQKKELGTTASHITAVDNVSFLCKPGRIFSLLGPNGAGKTTFALAYLPEVANCQHFINADLIAAGLAPLAPESQLLAASRIFLTEIKARVTARQNFAFETTLAGRTYLRLIQQLRSDG